MRFERLRIDNLRCIEHADIGLRPGVNLFVGDNGAGKTSVLEAAFMLSHARSFRAGTRDVLVRRQAATLHVYGEIQEADAGRHRVGLAWEGGRWQARLDGASAGRLGELLQACAVVCFEPGSHALIAGPSELRRRFLDWGVFHVEHDFLAVWRRYQRALKQRNSLLRAERRVADADFVPWEREMEAAATALDAWRRDYLDGFRRQVRELCRSLLPELGEPGLAYQPGWDETVGLGEDLARQRPRDRGRGHTTVGVHRAEWALTFEEAPQREHLSRGQEKSAALACTLAQAALYAERHGEWPVVCLDDLASELDLAHQRAVVGLLAARDAQVLVTGTTTGGAFDASPTHVFHVEHGRVMGPTAT